MPRYFFDTDDGERQVHDEAGIELNSLKDVRRETYTLLQNLSVPEVLWGKDRVFKAAVRDHRGTTIYRGSMVLKMDRNVKSA